jgi:hypothetical protein
MPGSRNFAQLLVSSGRALLCSLSLRVFINACESCAVLVFVGWSVRITASFVRDRRLRIQAAHHCPRVPSFPLISLRMDEVFSWFQERRLLVTIAFGSALAATLLFKGRQEQGSPRAITAQSTLQGQSTDTSQEAAPAAAPSPRLRGGRRALQIIEDNAEDHMDSLFERWVSAVDLCPNMYFIRVCSHCVR